MVFTLFFTTLLLLIQFEASKSSLIHGSYYTPLKNNKHPCIAENLKDAHRYICDEDANVICLAGWRQETDPLHRDMTNPCPIPVCEYDHKTCLHGDCVRPNICACKVGWEGHLCDKCVPLPGCEHGTCDNAFECNCEVSKVENKTLYEGAYCDEPACPKDICHPHHGQCLQPNVCTCHEGWEGENCLKCKKMGGCLNGDCRSNIPNTCECHPGWTGHLCDVPICRDGCSKEHGYCEEPGTCVCKTGWHGSTCIDCVPYWECPHDGECVKPNQCICSKNVTDHNGVCNLEIINGPKYGEFGECSNPCVYNEEYNRKLNLGPGKQTSKCLWSEHGEPCLDVESMCYGNKRWVFGHLDDIETCMVSKQVVHDHKMERGNNFIVKNGPPENYTMS